MDVIFKLIWGVLNLKFTVYEITYTYWQLFLFGCLVSIVVYFIKRLFE